VTGSPWLCLRCDWEGEADGAVCPRCGTLLYRLQEPPPALVPPPVRPNEPPVTVAEEPASAGSDHSASSPPASPSAPARPRRRLGPAARLGAAAAAAVLVAGVLWSIGDRSGPPAGPPRGGLHGTLVYASISANGTDGRLWRLDFPAMRLRRGPRTVNPSTLVASGPGGRWIGVVAGHAAYQFRSLGPLDLAQSFTFGDRVEWGPGGQQVFVAGRRANTGGCFGLRVASVDPVSHISTDLFSGRSCSVLTGMGVDGLSRPYISLTGPRPGVYLVGYRRLHRVVPQYTLLSISALGDMLVGPPATPDPARPEASPVTRTLLVWKGVGGPLVIGTARHDLAAERVLGWSPDGHRAAVLGTLDGLRSVWLVTSGAGTGRRRPVRIAPSLPPGETDVGAAFAGRVVLVDLGGLLFRSGPGGWRPVHLPRGAPAPHGPILWLPG
jgi:hypothetical protein